MARMIPPTIHSSVRSGAERALFAVLDKKANDEWICLHSLGLARHDYKRRGEIDFLLITPLGVFVLEVKGGRVRRENGMWVFTNRFGQRSSKSEGPFDQASSAMFALERRVRDGLGDKWADVLFGYGVALLDVEFTSVGVDADAEIVYDVRDREKPFARFVDRMARFTRDVQPRRRRAPSRKERDELTAFLRGDFDLQPTFGAISAGVKSAQARLTEEQQEVLDTFEVEPRLLVDGPAGSGKTVLALESVRRAARGGRRVLFVCFNRMLAAKVKAALSDEDLDVAPVVSTAHAFFRNLILDSSLGDEFDQRSADATDAELFDVLFPQYAALAALERPEWHFDMLVVDEAQDLLTQPILDALGESLIGGIQQGCWRVFLDANDQASVYGKLDVGALSALRSVGVTAVLGINCRNTRPIALQTSLVAEPKRRALGRIDGSPVEFHSYASRTECFEKLELVLKLLQEQGVKSTQVSVLFLKQPNDTESLKLEKLCLERLTEQDVTGERRDHAAWRWCPVSGFKGLENDVVVLVGIENLDDPWWRSVTYVGMSRARVQLHVLLNANCDDVRRQRVVHETLRRLGEIQ